MPAFQILSMDRQFWVIKLKYKVGGWRNYMVCFTSGKWDIYNFLCIFNAFHVAGECRRQVKQITNFVKDVNILEFGYYIWYPYEKCIQKSPNMPGIGSLIREIDVKISEIWETNILFLAQ